MNRYFEDTLYHLKRAGKTAKKGVAEEVEPVEEKVREMAGREKEPELSRLDKVRADLKELPDKVQREVREARENARATIDEYRAGRSNTE